MKNAVILVVDDEDIVCQSCALLLSEQGHDIRTTQDPQMLTDEGLRHTDRIDEFVHAVRVIGQQIDDREADGSGQRTEEAARRVVLLKFWVRDRER